MSLGAYVGNQTVNLNSLAVQNQTTASAFNGTGVDISQYEGDIAVTVSAPVASSADTIDFKVQESEDNSSFADVDSGTLVDANGDSATFTQVTDAVAVFETLYLKRGLLKRYVRVVATVAGTSPDVIFTGFLTANKASF